jgi:hypothetical protein
MRFTVQHNNISGELSDWSKLTKLRKLALDQRFFWLSAGLVMPASIKSAVYRQQ